MSTKEITSDLGRVGEQQPLVSIVTPSYNQGQFIQDTILSVRNQDYPNIEHIIVDGNSKDNTLDILRKYEDTCNMRWISEPDQGQADAINKGFTMATGEIFAWLNSDDIYLPGCVKTVANFFIKFPKINWLYGNIKTIDERGKVIAGYASQEFNLERLFIKNRIPQPAVFFRRRVVKEIGLLNTHLHYAMDYDYWVRMGLKYPARHIPYFLAAFRTHSQSRTSVHRLSSLKEEYIIRKNYRSKNLKIKTFDLLFYNYRRLRALFGK